MHVHGSLKLRWSAVSETGSDALPRNAMPAQYPLSKYFILNTWDVMRLALWWTFLATWNTTFLVTLRLKIGWHTFHRKPESSLGLYGLGHSIE